MSSLQLFTTLISVWWKTSPLSQTSSPCPPPSRRFSAGPHHRWTDSIWPRALPSSPTKPPTSPPSPSPSHKMTPTVLCPLKHTFMYLRLRAKIKENKTSNSNSLHDVCNTSCSLTFWVCEQQHWMWQRSLDGTKIEKCDSTYIYTSLRKANHLIIWGRSGP